MYQLKRDEEATLYEITQSRHALQMAAQYVKEDSREEYVEMFNFGKAYNEIYKIDAAKEAQASDKRTAQQIIDDTFSAMGIKVTGEGDV